MDWDPSRLLQLPSGIPSQIISGMLFHWTHLRVYLKFYSRRLTAYELTVLSYTVLSYSIRTMWSTQSIIHHLVLTHHGLCYFILCYFINFISVFNSFDFTCFLYLWTVLYMNYGHHLLKCDIFIIQCLRAGLFSWIWHFKITYNNNNRAFAIWNITLGLGQFHS